MPTLLLQLIGPMQSWGVQSNFTNRDTGLEPSKSGVVGLLCAALGRDRSEPIHDLAALRMGVRVDREGLVKKDYHTAKNVMKAGGGKPKETELSDRFYLADAAFLVGLESDDVALLAKLSDALLHPVWPLCLGRKAFVPGESIWIGDVRGKLDGIRHAPLHEALEQHPRLRNKRAFEDDRMRLMIEDEDGDIVRPDQPISFAKEARQFTVRRLKVDFVSLETQLKEAS